MTSLCLIFEPTGLQINSRTQSQINRECNTVPPTYRGRMRRRTGTNCVSALPFSLHNPTDCQHTDYVTSLNLSHINFFLWILVNSSIFAQQCVNKHNVHLGMSWSGSRLRGRKHWRKSISHLLPTTINRKIKIWSKHEFTPDIYIRTGKMPTEVVHTNIIRLCIFNDVKHLSMQHTSTTSLVPTFHMLPKACVVKSAKPPMLLPHPPTEKKSL